MDKKYNILIVDDHPRFLEMLEEILIMEGFSVTKAEDAEKAIVILVTNSFDLVITDYVMPGTNGLELISHIASIYPDIPCILCSSEPPEPEEVKYVEIIRKPCEFSQIISSANSVLQQ